MVYASDAPGRRAVLRVVGKRVEISLAEEWGDWTPRTRIVTSGASGSIQEEALRDLFDSCFGGPAS